MYRVPPARAWWLPLVLRLSEGLGRTSGETTRAFVVDTMFWLVTATVALMTPDREGRCSCPRDLGLGTWKGRPRCAWENWPRRPHKLIEIQGFRRSAMVRFGSVARSNSCWPGLDPWLDSNTLRALAQDIIFMWRKFSSQQVLAALPLVAVQFTPTGAESAGVLNLFHCAAQRSS